MAEKKLSQKALSILQSSLANKNSNPSVDSLKHQFGKMFDFESTMGGYDPNTGKAYGLTNFGYNESQLPYNKRDSKWQAPKNKQEAIEMLYNEIGDKLVHYPSAMEKGEAADFIYNTGRDPRVYMLDQYLKSKGQISGLPNRGAYNVDTKTDKWTPELENKLNEEWSKHKDNIMKLKENDRRILLNKGRDFFYQNINQVNGKPNPRYEATWKPRIWNSVNTY